MSAASPIPSEWIRRLQEIKASSTAAELTIAQGEPKHKAGGGEVEIWHYPLGVISRTVYSIHVMVAEDEVVQAYMHMEPAPDTEN